VTTDLPVNRLLKYFRVWGLGLRVLVLQDEPPNTPLTPP